jgi:endo-1,4-beta-D-glucanase Y
MALVAALVAVTGCRSVSPDRELLRQSWQGYRTRFVTADGRVVRPEHGGDTVSEGQAYTLLRAAWMDDQPTFDRVWRWTRTHLARTGRDGAALLAWHWSPRDGGHVDDWNVATDADADVALALLIAADRWPAPSAADLPGYGPSARAMLSDLAEHAIAADDRQTALLLPGKWSDQRAEGRGLVLNPSYLAPASYRLFHRATADERWLRLASSAYDVLETVCAGTPSGAVPDWVRWWSAERWSAEGAEGGRSSWDAVRVPWRVATDLMWFDEPRARGVLARCLEPSVRQHARAGAGLAVERTLTGRVLGADDHPLANALFAFALSEPDERDRLLARGRRQVVTGAGGLFFGDADHYYVNSLAYLPYLARAGRHLPPAMPAR